MPIWSRIEDASANPERVWMSREKETDDWRPLRKIDCQALNKCSSDGDSEVFIEFGRATADISEGVIRYNYLYNAPPLFLIGTFWFFIDHNNKRILTPITRKEDSDMIEKLYRRAITASSSFGEGIASVLQAGIRLEDESRVFVQKSGEKYSLVKKEKGLFGTTYDLQRGYGAYVHELEQIENKLGPVRHVAFVIHGVGENYYSRDDVETKSFRKTVDDARISLHRKQLQEWEKQRSKARRDWKPEPEEPPNRVELVPVEWFERIHSSSSFLMKSLKSATLPTIPAFREFVGEFVFDVMMYLTPSFCEAVLECVTEQILQSYQLFMKVYPNFIADGGKFSLIGHSLGSVVIWDLLSVLKDAQDLKQNHVEGGPMPRVPGVAIRKKDSADIGYETYVTEENANQGINGTWGPTLTKPMKQTIPFVPENSILLGSPLSMFLTLRGAHAVFDEMRVKPDDIFADVLNISPFSLPSGSLYNIFHGSDPVAYRIEPMLLSQETDSEDFPPPAYLTSLGRGVRFHVKAKDLSDDMFKSLSNLSKPKKRSSFEVEPEDLKFPLGGKSDRVDYVLQPSVVVSEYISAIAAHSTYFESSDVLEFLIDVMGTQDQVVVGSIVTVATQKNGGVDSQKEDTVDRQGQDDVDMNTLTTREQNDDCNTKEITQEQANGGNTIEIMQVQADGVNTREITQEQANGSSTTESMQVEGDVDNTKETMQGQGGDEKGTFSNA